MKQANGYGGIVKLGGRRRKPYAVIKTSGWIQLFDENGLPVGKPKQQRQYIGYYATRKEAMKALVEANEQTPAPIKETPKTALNQPYTPTFAQLWQKIRSIRKSTWSQQSLCNYDAGFDRSEAIHNKRIDTITYLDLQKLMNAYAKEGKTKGSLTLYRAFLSLVFSEAEKMNYIPSSPVKYIKIKPTAETKQRKPLTPETIKAVYNSKCKSRDIVLILIYSGMRANELLNIKEVHEDYVVTGSKTSAGKNRIVPIHPQIKEELKRFLSGKKLTYDAYRRILENDCAVYGASFTMHECRHTFITLANQYGMDLYAIKRIVGHSTRDITEQVYTHIQASTLKREIEKIPFVTYL